MSYSFIKTFLALSLVWMRAESQDFCDSFAKNEHKVIVFSHMESSDCLLIIGNNYWLLNTKSKYLLAFDKEDRMATNSSDLLDKRYTYAIEGTIGRYINSSSLTPLMIMSNEPVFYIAEKMLFNFVKYKSESKTFENYPKRAQAIELIPFQVEINYHSLGFPLKNHTNCFVSQRYDSNTKLFRRKFEYHSVESTNERMTYIDFKRFYQKPDIDTNLNKLSKTLELVGVHDMRGVESNPTTFIIFRDHSSLLYCILDECVKNRYNTLIDCSPEQSDWTLLIIIVCVVLVVVLLIVGIVIYTVYKKRGKPRSSKGEKRRSRTHRKDIP